MKTSLIVTGAMGLLMTAQVFAADAAKGKGKFEATCSACHNADSTEQKMGPGLKGMYKRAKLANGKAVTDANVLALINQGGTVMPPLADTLSKPEKEDIIAYLRTL